MSDYPLSENPISDNPTTEVLLYLNFVVIPQLYEFVVFGVGVLRNSGEKALDLYGFQRVKIT